MGTTPRNSLPLSSLGRRSFLWSLASFGLTAGAKNFEKLPETNYRFHTPECEVHMTVEFFGSDSAGRLLFRDKIANRQFCLSQSGAENQDCLPRFSGSMAIVTYQFQAHGPVRLRENVVTIDHDPRMAPRPPFEKALTIENGIASDIQAFGYNPDDASREQPLMLWCLLRQNLYLNDQSNPFLIVHWKHTFDTITIVDVIPGAGTQLLG